MANRAATPDRPAMPFHQGIGLQHHLEIRFGHIVLELHRRRRGEHRIGRNTEQHLVLAGSQAVIQRLQCCRIAGRRSHLRERHNRRRFDRLADVAQHMIEQIDRRGILRPMRVTLCRTALNLHCMCECCSTAQFPLRSRQFSVSSSILLAQPLFRFPMGMIFQLLMKLLTDKPSLTCAVLLVTCLVGRRCCSQSWIFALLFFSNRGMFMVLGLLWSGIGQKRSELADRG